MERKRKGTIAYRMKPSFFKDIVGKKTGKKNVVGKKTGKKNTDEDKKRETTEGIDSSEPYQRDGRLYKMVNGKEVDITPKETE